MSASTLIQWRYACMYCMHVHVCVYKGETVPKNDQISHLCNRPKTIHLHSSDRVPPLAVDIMMGAKEEIR